MFKKIIFTVIFASLFFSMFTSEKITSTVYADSIYYYDDYSVNVWNGYLYLPVNVHIGVSEDYESRSYGAYIGIQTSYMSYDGLVLSSSSYSRTAYYSDGTLKTYSPIYSYDTRNVMYQHMDYNYIKWEPDWYALLFSNYGDTINTHTITFDGSYSPSTTTYKTQIRYSF